MASINRADFTLLGLSYNLMIHISKLPFDKERNSTTDLGKLSFPESLCMQQSLAGLIHTLKNTMRVEILCTMPFPVKIVLPANQADLWDRARNANPKRVGETKMF